MKTRADAVLPEQTAEGRGEADTIETLAAALYAARGWVVTCSDSALARADLRRIDKALALAAPEDADG